jgi:hypothetical protein
VARTINTATMPMRTTATATAMPTVNTVPLLLMLPLDSADSLVRQTRSFAEAPRGSVVIVPHEVADVGHITLVPHIDPYQHTLFVSGPVRNDHYHEHIVAN